MKIQQMALNRVGIIAECRTISHVRNRVKAFHTYAGACDVHAVAGYQFLITAQVDRWNRVLCAVAAPASRGGLNAEGSAEQSARTTHAPFLHQFTNARA